MYNDNLNKERGVKTNQRIKGKKFSKLEEQYLTSIVEVMINKIKFRIKKKLILVNFHMPLIVRQQHNNTATQQLNNSTTQYYKNTTTTAIIHQQQQQYLTSGGCFKVRTSVKNIK